MQRRNFVKLSCLAPAASFSAGAPKKTVAAVVTEYRHWSHADVICGRLLGGNSANNRWSPPRTRLVSMHAVQMPANDMTRDLAARHGFKRFNDIRGALTLGGDKLAVDAVVFVGEHGQYPFNSDGQHLYPRYELFNQILDVYETSGRGVPTFFDKHFSYDWTKASTLFARARKLKFPLMAGSSLPVALRKPSLQPDLETPMTEAAAIGHGPLDAYGFHLLESMQCWVERRKGGETGVAEVEFIAGNGIWEWLASENGKWAQVLLQEAYKRDPKYRPVPFGEVAKEPALFRIQYRDGLRAVALMLTPSGNDRTLAVGIPGQPQPVSLMIGVDVERPLPHFDGLVHCIEEMIVTGKEQYPPERTLLTTGILAHAFDSKRARKALPTHGLNFAYRAPREVFFQIE